MKFRKLTPPPPTITVGRVANVLSWHGIVISLLFVATILIPCPCHTHGFSFAKILACVCVGGRRWHKIAVVVQSTLASFARLGIQCVTEFWAKFILDGDDISGELARGEHVLEIRHGVLTLDKVLFFPVGVTTSETLHLHMASKWRRPLMLVIDATVSGFARKLFIINSIYMNKYYSCLSSHAKLAKTNEAISKNWPKTTFLTSFFHSSYRIVELWFFPSETGLCIVTWCKKKQTEKVFCGTDWRLTTDQRSDG